MRRASFPLAFALSCPLLLRRFRVLGVVGVIALAPGIGSAAQEGTTSDASLPEAAQAQAEGGPAAAQDAAAPGPLARRCESPEEIAPEQARIDRIAVAVDQPDPPDQPLVVVVLGSLSGQNVGNRDAVAFAPRLQEVLQSQLSARGVRRPVQVRQVGKMRALSADLARLVDREVLPLKPALVIWQVGRSDPRQGNPPNRFAEGLKDGISRLRKAGIPVIVGDIQFHPQFEALFRTAEYRNYVRWVAGEYDLPLLRRHEMIDDWSRSGRIDLDSGDDADQNASYAFIQECLAFQAARLILGAAGLAQGNRQGGT